MTWEAEAVMERIETACRELGLNRTAIHTIVKEVRPAALGPGGDLSQLREENRRLAAEVQTLRVERDRLLQRQREIGRLIGAESDEKLMHDLRNVLNELSLLHAVVEQQQQRPGADQPKA